MLWPTMKFFGFLQISRAKRAKRFLGVNESDSNFDAAFELDDKQNRLNVLVLVADENVRSLKLNFDAFVPCFWVF